MQRVGQAYAKAHERWQDSVPSFCKVILCKDFFSFLPFSIAHICVLIACFPCTDSISSLYVVNNLVQEKWNMKHLVVCVISNFFVIFNFLYYFLCCSHISQKYGVQHGNGILPVTTYAWCILLELPSKCQISHITHQEVCALVKSLFHRPGLCLWRQGHVTQPVAILSKDVMYTSPSPWPRIFHDETVTSSRS